MKRRDDFGLTMFELVMVVIVIVVLIAILVPSSDPQHRLAMRTRCAANLKNAAAAMMMYDAEYGVWPVGNSGKRFGGQWMCDEPKGMVESLSPYLSSRSSPGSPPKEFYCPAGTQVPTTLWNDSGTFRVVGYVFLNDRSTFADSELPRIDAGSDAGLDLTYRSGSKGVRNPEKSVVAADWVVSDMPGDAVTKWSGFSYKGRPGVYATSHIANGKPTSASVLFVDGHTETKTYSKSSEAVAIKQSGGADAPYFWLPIR